MTLASLGVCCCPEHSPRKDWPRENWPRKVATMRDGGIELVRIGEFAWSRSAPNPTDTAR